MCLCRERYLRIYWGRWTFRRWIALYYICNIRLACYLECLPALYITTISSSISSSRRGESSLHYVLNTPRSGPNDEPLMLLSYSVKYVIFSESNNVYCSFAFLTFVRLYLSIFYTHAAIPFMCFVHQGEANTVLVQCLYKILIESVDQRMTEVIVYPSMPDGCFNRQLQIGHFITVTCSK